MAQAQAKFHHDRNDKVHIYLSFWLLVMLRELVAQSRLIVVCCCDSCGHATLSPLRTVRSVSVAHAKLSATKEQSQLWFELLYGGGDEIMPLVSLRSSISSLRQLIASSHYWAMYASPSQYIERASILEVPCRYLVYRLLFLARRLGSQRRCCHVGADGRGISACHVTHKTQQNSCYNEAHCQLSHA